MYSDHNAAVYEISSPSSEQSRRSKSSRFISKPSWLLLSISDMEDKMQTINREHNPDTFGERADFYYRKRPELLALLQDLYNRYLYLADRYTRSLSKHQHNHLISDAESRLSYHPPDASESLISELVMKFVEHEIAVEELQIADIIQEELTKKIELQRSLLEVLDSERVVLTNENARLESENVFMKRKLGELARCCVVSENHDDRRVSALNRKIDDLHNQIHELEKTNTEYFDRLTKQDENKKNNFSNIDVLTPMLQDYTGTSTDVSTTSADTGASASASSSISWSGGGGDDETGSTSNHSTCTSLAQAMKRPRGGGGSGGRKACGWWGKVKRFDVFACGPHLRSTG